MSDPRQEAERGSFPASVLFTRKGTTAPEQSASQGEMSPNISLASTLSGGHVGHRGAWENVRLAKGKAVSTADASEGKKGESLPADGPAVSAIVNLQAIDGIPLFSVSWGPVETQGGSCQISTQYRWWPREAALIWDAGATQPRGPSLGDTGGTQPRCPHSPARAPARPAPPIRQPGASADGTPGSLSPSSLGANTSCFLVSWIPHQGRKAEKRIRLANCERGQSNSSCRPTEH